MGNEKKANGTYRACVTAQRYEQISKQHNDQDSCSSTVVPGITIRLVLALIIMAGWHKYLMDVHGAFLKGEFKDGETIYMIVPQGFERFYAAGTVLKLLQTIYRLKQVAIAFWREVIQAFTYLGYHQSTADLCMYYA
jgi:Reverse transcriptase (RNA-dependent DNA polymerase)